MHMPLRRRAVAACAGAVHILQHTCDNPLSVLHAGLVRVHACKWGRCFNFRLNYSLRSCVCSQSPPTPYTQVQIITNKALSGQECRKARGALDTIATPCSPRRVLHSQPAGGNKNWRVRNVSSSRASARALSHHLVWHVPPPAIAQR